MKGMLITCGAGLLAFASPAALAQSASSPCYLEISKLVADPPQGVEELGTALHRLDEALRPQVEEIKVLQEQLDRIQQRQREALQSEEEIDLVALQADEQRIAADLEAKRSQLKLDYAEQRRALVAPVQTRVSQRAQAFASEHGCKGLKMARAGDLANLRAASARNMTATFVAWYDGN
jgi:Skp family chaperone for outer membrane proteins